MSTEVKKEMKEEMQRGYYEVNFLLRAANVNKRVIGYSLIRSAIMAYLHDPSLRIEQLAQKALENSPMTLRVGCEKMTEKERKELLEEKCLSDMQEAIQNVYTKHYNKLGEKDAVFHFIDNIATEIRVKELIRIRIANEELDADETEAETLAKIVIRRIVKSQDTFKEILNHVAGRVGYDETADLVKDVHKIVNINEVSDIQAATADVSDLVEELIEKKNTINF